MQIFVGLGNPGKQYQHTRHNVGFMMVDRLAEEAKVDFTENKKFQALFAKSQLYEQEIFFLKPQTYMNASGQAVRALLDFYKILPEFEEQQKFYRNLFVIHDDLDIAFGESKTQFGKGPKIHNGLNSIYQQIGTEQFWHVRVGVDSRNGNRVIPGKDYVLTSFSIEEKQQLEVLANRIKQKLQMVSISQ